MHRDRTVFNCGLSVKRLVADRWRNRTALGNLGRDPEMRYMASGDAIANVGVATSYKSRDRNTGEQKELTEWHRISFFGRLAEIVGQCLKKGSQVYVEGRLQTRKHTDKASKIRNRHHCRTHADARQSAR